MGRFMIPVCCVCGVAATCWRDDEWMINGGLQDFCPEHATDSLIQYHNGEEMKSQPKKLNVTNCARCGKDHKGIEFRKLKKPAISGKTVFRYFAHCPETKEPLLMCIARIKITREERIEK